MRALLAGDGVDGVAAAPDHDCVFCYVQVRVNSPIHIFCECGISSSPRPKNNSTVTDTACHGWLNEWPTTSTDGGWFCFGFET